MVYCTLFQHSTTEGPVLFACFAKAPGEGHIAVQYEERFHKNKAAKGVVTVGVEPTTAALLAPRSTD